jgi:predicted metal-dependent phosphotriesterase family hydrolase
VSKDRYQADEAFRVALPHLRRIKELGCRSLVECTPAFLGRDPALLRRLSEASGLQIITNTGYYSAVEANSCRPTPTPKRPTNWPRGGWANGATASTARASGRASSRSAWTKPR